MSKHTPGPWTISDDHGKRWIETLANDDTICEVHRRNTRVGRDRDEEFHANAHLIESAPDMLAALEKAAQAMWNSEANMDTEAAELEVVIAKAKGA